MMTLFVRDEADIIETLLQFHFAVGVDFVVATDNGSTDGTAEILEAHEREGRLHLIREPRDVSQEEHVTHMASLAATRFGADWVINSDGDEFWRPHSGSLKDLFAGVPARFATVRGSWAHFPPRPGDRPFIDRLTARLCVPQPPRWHSHFKTAHRGDPDVVVSGGNHDAKLSVGHRFPENRLDVHHFPYRSAEQFERKTARAVEVRLAVGLRLDELELRHQEAWNAHQRGDLRKLYESYVVSDRVLRKGLRKGTYEIDTRLRDFLNGTSNPPFGADPARQGGGAAERRPPPLR